MTKSSLKTKIKGVAFVIIGALVLACGAYQAHETYQACTSWQTTEGRVTNVEKTRGRRGRTNYKAHYSYRIPGSYEVYHSYTSFSGSSYRRNDKVEVLYDPANPSKSKLNNFMDIYLLTIILLGLGALLFFSGIITCKKKEEKPTDTPEEEPSTPDQPNQEAPTPGETTQN